MGDSCMIFMQGKGVSKGSSAATCTLEMPEC